MDVDGRMKSPAYHSTVLVLHRHGRIVGTGWNIGEAVFEHKEFFTVLSGVSLRHHIGSSIIAVFVIQLAFYG